MAGSREHVAVRVAQGEHVLRPTEPVAESLQDRDAHAQCFQPLAPLSPLFLGQNYGASLERRIYMKHVATSQPRIEHELRNIGIASGENEIGPRPLTRGLRHHRVCCTRVKNGGGPPPPLLLAPRPRGPAPFFGT